VVVNLSWREGFGVLWWKVFRKFLGCLWESSTTHNSILCHLSPFSTLFCILLASQFLDSVLSTSTFYNCEEGLSIYSLKNFSSFFKFVVPGLTPLISQFMIVS